MKRLYSLILICSLQPSLAQAADDAFLDLDFEALVNVQLASSIAMGLHHTHPRGEWMVGYRYMDMHMDGNLDGTDNVSTAEILDPAGLNFMVAPKSMDMQMHMFSLMYGLTDNLTVMGMLPYKRNSMDHVTRSNIKFTTHSDGIGDVSLTGLYTFHRGSKHRFHLVAGLSLPTGSIDKKDDLPSSGGKDVQLPYPMQLGSGTTDLLAGLTYLGYGEDWTWGATVDTTIRLGENANDYTLGNAVSTDLWASRTLYTRFNLIFRLHGKKWGNIDGADPALNPAVVPTADPNLRAGTRFDATIGLSLYEGAGRFEGNRLAIEYGVPVYQSLDGPQLKMDRLFNVSWQYVF